MTVFNSQVFCQILMHNFVQGKGLCCLWSINDLNPTVCNVCYCYMHWNPFLAKYLTKRLKAFLKNIIQTNLFILLLQPFWAKAASE